MPWMRAQVHLSAHSAGRQRLANVFSDKDAE
jgi:hypothetical protein